MVEDCAEGDHLGADAVRDHLGRQNPRHRTPGEGEARDVQQEE